MKKTLFTIVMAVALALTACASRSRENVGALALARGTYELWYSFDYGMVISAGKSEHTN